MALIFRIRSVIVFILLLISIRVPGFYTRQYNTGNSLISNNIYFIFKDSKGYLWFFSDKGVSKFDGEQFRNFTLSDGLGDNEIFKAYEDKAGRLWLFTGDGSPSYIYKDQVHNTANDKRLKKLPLIPYMNEMYEDIDSSLYIGYNSGDVLQVRNGKISWIYKNTDVGQAVNSIYKVNGIIKIALRDTMLCVKDKIILKRDKIANSQSFAQKDKLLLTDDQGIKIYRQDTLIWRLDNSSLNVHTIVRLFLNDKGFLFCCTDKGLIIVNIITGAQWKLFPNIVITCVAEDINGDFWISTLHNGVYFADKRLDDIKLIGDISSYDFTYAKNGQLFFEDRYRAYRLAGDSAIKPEKIDVPIPMWYHPLYIDSELLFYTLSRLPNKTYYYNKVSRKVYMTPEYAKLVLPYKKRGFLLMGMHCVYNCELLYGKLRTNNKIEFDKGRINMPVLGNDHNFYFLHDSCVYQYNPFTNKLIKIDSFKPDEQVVSIVSYRSGLILKVNDGATIYYKLPSREKVIKQNKLLIYDVYKCVNGDDLLYTNEGYYLSQKNSEDTVTYTSLKKAELPFRQKDILFLYPYKDKIVCNVGGKLYSFSQQLLAPVIDTPRLFLRSISIDDKVYTNRVIVLNNTTGCDVKLEFSSLYFNNTKNDIQYRIITNGIPGKWYTQAMGVLNILLNHWGNYLIEIKATNENNIESAVQIISLELKPPFYYRSVFYVILLSLLTGLICYMGYRYNRKRKLKFLNELDYLQLENKAINSLLNPHFIFNAINNIMGLINSGSLQNINSYLSTLSKLIRQNIENLQFNFIPMEKELSLLRNYIYLQNLRFGDRITLKINDHTQMAASLQIPPLLIHTFVENAVIHGFAKGTERYEIVVDIDLSHDDYLIIRIRDNGVGFNMSKQTVLKDKTSLGIDFNKKRLQRISEFYKVDYRLDVNSKAEEGQGTEVLIIIYSRFQDKYVRH